MPVVRCVSALCKAPHCIAEVAGEEYSNRHTSNMRQTHAPTHCYRSDPGRRRNRNAQSDKRERPKRWCGAGAALPNIADLSVSARRPLQRLHQLVHLPHMPFSQAALSHGERSPVVYVSDELRLGRLTTER